MYKFVTNWIGNLNISTLQQLIGTRECAIYTDTDKVLIVKKLREKGILIDRLIDCKDDLREVANKTEYLIIHILGIDRER